MKTTHIILAAVFAATTAMGLLQGVKDSARSSGGAILQFAADISGNAADLIKPYSGDFSLGFGPRFDNYSSACWPLGRASLTGSFTGNMTSTPYSSGGGGIYSYNGSATVSFDDTFSDPYNILERLYGNSNTTDAPQWLQNAANGVYLPGSPWYVQGTPFSIVGNWTESFSGGGTYE